MSAWLRIMICRADYRKTVKTSDDFRELATNAENEAKTLKYAKKVIELDENNIDAAGLKIELSAPKCT